MKNSRKTDRCIVNRSEREKRSLGRALSEVWQDLQADPKWKYEQLAPVQLLEKSELRVRLTDSSELVRATWFWSRRPTVAFGRQHYALGHCGLGRRRVCCR
jgi:hypothetical protein